MSHYDLKFPCLRIAKNPHEREANCAQAYDAPFIVVGPQSPATWCKAIEEMAFYFKREMKYEFAGYSTDQRWNPAFQRDRVLVFCETGVKDRESTLKNHKDFSNFYTLFGAISIRWRESKDTSGYWVVDWVWLHPYERRQGHLTRAWPFILKMFPNPHVEEPLSAAMEAFLKKINYQNPQFRAANQN